MNVDLLIKENKELSEEKQRYKEMWFITNNSLAKYRKLEEQLGCPLEVVFKAIINGIIVDGSTYQVKVGKDIYGYFFILSNGSSYPFYLKNYKKSWWLKKDKSE